MKYATIEELSQGLELVRADLDNLRGIGGRGLMYGDLDMNGFRVINGEQSVDQTDYVTREELGSYVSGSGMAIETFAGSGTSYTLTSKASNTSAVILFINGVAGENGGSAAGDFTVNANRQRITTNTSLSSADFVLALYVQEAT